MSFLSNDEQHVLPETGPLRKLSLTDLPPRFERQQENMKEHSHRQESRTQARRYLMPLEDATQQLESEHSLRENTLDYGFADLQTLTRAGKAACLQTLPQLQEALGDPSISIRTAAVEALARFEKGAPLNALLCALTDFSWQVRTAAAQSLGRTGLPLPVAALVMLLEQEDDENVREAIIRAFGQQPRMLPTAVMLRFLFHDQSWLVRTAAAWALGELQEHAPVQSLLDVLAKEHDEYVRAAVIKALGKAGNQVAFEALLKSLEDPDEEVRDAAVWALQQLDTESRGFTQYGEVYHLDKQLTAEEQLFFMLAELIRDKRGWIDEPDIRHTHELRNECNPK